MEPGSHVARITILCSRARAGASISAISVYICITMVLNIRDSSQNHNNDNMQNKLMMTRKPQ